MLTTDETAALQKLVATTPMVDSSWNEEHATRVSQTAHSAITKLLQRELSEAPHEVDLIRRVLTAVPEYTSDACEYVFGRKRVKSGDRKTHDQVVTEAVHATLAVLGFVIRPDGSLAGP